MIFLVDESVESQIVEVLRQDNHSVLYVAEMDPGISDDSVLEKAEQNSAILITADRDFGELVFRQRRITHGVVLVRLAGLSSSTKAELVSAAINKHLKAIQNAFSVISPSTIRIRHIS